MYYVAIRHGPHTSGNCLTFKANYSVDVGHRSPIMKISVCRECIYCWICMKIVHLPWWDLCRHVKYKCSGTSPYGHLTSKKTSPLQSPWLSPKLYSTVQITPCNKVTSALRSLLPSPVGDLNSEVPL